MRLSYLLVAISICIYSIVIVIVIASSDGNDNSDRRRQHGLSLTANNININNKNVTAAARRGVGAPPPRLSPADRASLARLREAILDNIQPPNRESAKARRNSPRLMKCHHSTMEVRKELAAGHWDSVAAIRDRSKKAQKKRLMYSYSPCLTTYNLGNSLGNYFNEVTCAMAARVELMVSYAVT